MEMFSVKASCSLRWTSFPIWAGLGPGPFRPSLYQRKCRLVNTLWICVALKPNLVWSSPFKAPMPIYSVAAYNIAVAWCHAMLQDYDCFQPH